jgi:hypothetical protein
VDSDQETHLHVVADRLAAEFGEDRSRVETRVRAAYERWGDARVRNFLPIIVERAVREELHHTGARGDRPA